MRILGVDCAGVILNPCIGSVPDAFESLRKIAQSGRFEKIYIVSQVNLIGRLTFAHRLWLRDIWNYTGIPEKNLYFCRYRYEKSIFCKKLGITDFIDDNLEVLSYMHNVDRLYAFNPRWRRNIERHELPHRIAFFSSWKELTPRLLA